MFNFNPKKIYIKILLFLLFYLTLSLIIHKLLLYGLDNYNYDEIGRWNRIKSGKINADILFMGSSRSLYHYNCNIIDSILQTKSYNLGLDAHIINYQLPMLKFYLKYNKKPDYVILNFDISFLWIQNIPGIEKYVNVLDDNDIYANLVSIDKSIFFYKYLPLYRFIITRYPIKQAINSIFSNSKVTRDNMKGALLVNKVFENDIMEYIGGKKSGYTVEINNDGINKLVEFIDFCKDSNIKLIFIFSPEYYEIYKYLTNRQSVKEIFLKISQEYNIPYYDFSDTCALSYDKNNFYNTQHLNENGANKFSKYLSYLLINVIK